MATLLDTGLFDSLSIIFTWLLVFLVMFGILEVTNFFKNRSVHALLAFVIAILTGFSSITVGIVETMLPWFLVIAFFAFFIFMIGRFMGIADNTILGALGGDAAIWWILVLGFIIVAAALSNAFGQSLLDERTGDAGADSQQSVIIALTNPKVLGFFLILLIGAFTVLFMSRQV